MATQRIIKGRGGQVVVQGFGTNITEVNNNVGLLDDDGISAIYQTEATLVHLVNLPSAANNPGRIITIGKKATGGFAYDINRAGSDTIEGKTQITLFGQYSKATLQSNGVDTWYVLELHDEGTYTPTPSAESGGTSTQQVMSWKRSGDFVKVIGAMNIDGTASSSYSISLSLPVASNLTANGDLGGSGSNSLGDSLRILPDTTNEVALLRTVPSDSADNNYSIIFVYKVT